MNNNRRVGFVLFLTGLLVISGILLRSFLLLHFVRPAALMLWSGYRLIASFDQAFYWAGLILVLAFLSLVRLSRRVALDGDEDAEHGNATLNSIQHWRTLVLLGSDETDQVNYLKQSMQRLLKDVYASKQPAQVRWKIYQEVEQGDIPLPGWIRTFLLLDPPAKPRLTLIQRMRQAPAQWTRRRARQDQAKYYQSIAEVISFMEKELENEDDG